ncbi:MAG: hypothetical protein J0L64_20035 [Acidobacteria bacterium]|nr:hypothetical protein [Acidobacteriota bacterium]
MSFALIVASRGVTFTKDEWRRPGMRRTLAAIDTGPLVEGAFRDLEVGPTPLVCTVEWEGTAIRRQSVGPLKRHHGVFEIAVREDGSVRLVLREEACSSLYGTPRRHTQRVATLAPWRTVRVLINGRYSSYSGQTYLVHEYYWTLCEGAPPERWPEAVTVDLQADLS